MKLSEIDPRLLSLDPELSRSGSAKSFEERLRSSIEEVGLVEPLKVALRPTGGFLVIDGTLRLRAINAIREKDPARFVRVPVYILDWEKRYELRYQSDIYQDLLPSQLAALVEHLHLTENIMKTDIARYIGVSPATLRNYTGLWRLLQRGGLFAEIVQLMDIESIPSSNPYAWLRLTPAGLRKVLTESFSDGNEPEAWIGDVVRSAREGNTVRFPIKFVEATTASLPPEYYRVAPEVRMVKRDIGLRKGASQSRAKTTRETAGAIANLERVSTDSPDEVLRAAAVSLREYLL